MQKRESDRTIHAIKSEFGTPVASHKEINCTFWQFYEKLHTRGPRQGCALSPLLFALALETLSETIGHIWKYMVITVILYTSNKLSLYVDDILMHITMTQTTVPVLLKTIDFLVLSWDTR